MARGWTVPARPRGRRSTPAGIGAWWEQSQLRSKWAVKAVSDPPPTYTDEARARCSAVIATSRMWSHVLPQKCSHAVMRRKQEDEE